MGEVRREVNKLQKSYFDVLGLCCSSEVPLIEKILHSLEGIHKVSVVVPSRTVIVVHDTALISQIDIVKALNQARLEASIRAYGTERTAKRWPSPYIMACGLLLLTSLFKFFFQPLKWVALAAVVVGLPPIILRSIAAIRRYTLDINILMLIAVSGAVALRDYSEAGFIVFLFTIAEWLESRASHKATAGMSSLMSLAPQKAILEETGQVVDVQDVMINTVLAVKAGEVIPIDGVVVEGRSEVDESSLTGESFPVTKQAESPVWAGTLNIDGYISVKTTALAENSAVAKMARLVEEAQNSRSNTQRLIDSCAKYYTPAVVVIAGGVAVIPMIVRAHNPKQWFQFALVLLVSACPCALVLSTPVATFCALLKAARTGLLVKGGDVLEALAKTKVVALDKTGTITRGEFTVMEFRKISEEVTFDKLIYWVSSVESKSSHPMASALVDFARSSSIEPKPENVREFQIYPGEGIYGEIEGENIYVGNKRITTRAGCLTVPRAENIKEGVTVGYVFSGAVPIGVFTLSDTCRTGAIEAIKELKSLGVKTAMLTGDSSMAAMHAQNQLGDSIEMIHAELLPEDKVRIVSDLKAKEGCTVMVGDGLNDAPALAMATVGISMGVSGSAVAMETSHVTLMSNDIRKIPKAIRLARRTHRKIMINIFFSLITKIAILALAIAGHPLLWAAVLADVGTCLVVILNSMMLLRTKKTKDKHCHSSHRAPGQCCGSSHKSHTHNPTHENHCTGGVCGSSAESGQSKCASRPHDHSCHDHKEEEKESSAICGQSKCASRPHDHSCHDHKETGKDISVVCKQSKCASRPHGHSCHDHKEAEKERSAVCGRQSKCASRPHDHSCHDHKEAERESSAVCGQSKCASLPHDHICHDHRAAEKERTCQGHSCHDYGTAKEETAHNNCPSTCQREPCHTDLPNYSHVSSADHEHVISITNEAECHRDGLHEEHSGGHSKCCSQAMCGNQPPRNSIADMASELSRTELKKEMTDCCGNGREECGIKDGCSSSIASKGGVISCGTSHQKESCRIGLLNHPHCEPRQAKHLTNVSYPGLISDGPQEHSLGHGACCSEPALGKDCGTTSHHVGFHSTCASLQKERKIFGMKDTFSPSHVCLGKGELDGCCRSYSKECEKGGCCAAGIVQLPEIIIEQG